MSFIKSCRNERAPNRMEIYRKPFTLMAFPSSKVKQQKQQQQHEKKGTVLRFWFGLVSVQNFSRARSEILLMAKEPNRSKAKRSKAKQSNQIW